MSPLTFEGDPWLHVAIESPVNAYTLGRPVELRDGTT